MRDFHLGDLISISDGRLVSPRHIGGVYDILGWMAGEELFTHQLPRVADACQGPLLKQHPFLGGPEMAVMLADLTARLSNATDAKDVVSTWLGEAVAQFGEMHAVEPLPGGCEYKNPLEEMLEIAGDRPVFGIAAGGET